MPTGFVKALISHSKQVQDLQGDQAVEFLRLLKQLEMELQGRLLSVSDADQPLDYLHYLRIDGETKSAIATLEQKLNGQYGTAQKDAADLALDHIAEEVDRLSKAFGGETEDISLSAVKALADPAQLLLANHFDTSVKRYGLDVLNQVRQRVLVGIRTGDTVGTIAKTLTGNQGPLGSFGRSAGERLVRTEISHAYGAASHSGLVQAEKQVQGLKKVWLHVASFLCPTCGPLHGTERPIDGTWTIKIGKKARQVSGPPGHPNCTCRVSAMKPSWRKGLEKLGYLEEQKTTGEEGHAAL